MANRRSRRHLGGALGQRASRPLRAQLATATLELATFPHWQHSPTSPHVRQFSPCPTTTGRAVAPRPPHRERPRLSRPNTSPSRPFGEAALLPLPQPTNCPIHGFRQPSGQTTTPSHCIQDRLPSTPPRLAKLYRSGLSGAYEITSVSASRLNDFSHESVIWPCSL